MGVGIRGWGGRFAELFSREIWSAIGAERDAEIILDHSDFSVVEGGICTTLRDLGRFGQMCLQAGELSGRQVVPADWLRRLAVPDRELIDAYASAGDLDPAKPDAFYHDTRATAVRLRGLSKPAWKVTRIPRVGRRRRRSPLGRSAGAG